MLISDIMTRDVLTISPDASLKDVGTVLKEKRISGIPVVDEKGHLIGIVTLTDMLRVLNSIYTWKKLQLRASISKVDLSEWHQDAKVNAKVKDIMTKEVCTISESESLDSLIRIVFTKNIHTIPVTREGKLVGIVGMRDLVYSCF